MGVSVAELGFIGRGGDGGAAVGLRCGAHGLAGFGRLRVPRAVLRGELGFPLAHGGGRRAGSAVFLRTMTKTACRIDGVAMALKACFVKKSE